MGWRNIRFECPDESTEWRARRGQGRIVTGKAIIESLVAKWQPLDPLVISAPGSHHFYPVLAIEQYRDRAFNTAKRLHAFSIILTLAMTALFGILYLLKQSQQDVAIITMSLVLFSYFALDYKLVIQRIDRLSERADFVVWVYANGRTDVVMWAAIMSLLAATQLTLNQLSGGFEGTFYRFGAVYEIVNAGEWWRLVTGSVFHSGIAHWLANIAMVLIIGPVIGVISRSQGIVVFLIGNTIGSIAAFVTFSIGLSTNDAYAGVSGGIYAMMGYIVGHVLLNSSAFPQKFVLSVSSFVVLCLTLTWLMLSDSSLSAHVFGMMAGFLYACVIQLLLSRPSQASIDS